MMKDMVSLFLSLFVVVVVVVVVVLFATTIFLISVKG